MIPSPLPEGPLVYNGPNGPVPIPALYQAVLRKDSSRVDVLLKDGADSNEMCPCGTSPLEAAVFQAKDAQITELLLAHGADPNRRTPKNLKGSTNGWTPLFYAVYEKRADLVGLLLKHRAKIDIADIQGKTPLMLARERKAPDVIKKLEDAGARR
jgi:ankyrin repeat protein